MSVAVMAIRPEPGCAATVSAGLAQGLPMVGCPLFEVRPRDWMPPSPATIDGLLIGSANAVRHAAPWLAAFLDKPVYAVGEATAAAAVAAGLSIAAVGVGGLQEVLDTLVPPPLRLLRLAGEEHVLLRPPAGVSIETRVVYAADPVPMPGPLAQVMSGGAIVLLHSAAAARHFAAECDRLAIARSTIRIAALGPRIAAAAGEGWGACCAASHPAEAALLALANDLCHASPRSEEP